MIERGYMNQEDSKTQLKVKLHKEDEVDLLEFNLGSKIHKLNVNAEDNQADIKAMFCDLVILVEENPIELVLEVAEEYDNKLLEEVSQAYIGDLNKELDSVRSEIVDKYGSDDEGDDNTIG